jgi:hypothetical protein
VPAVPPVELGAARPLEPALARPVVDLPVDDVDAVADRPRRAAPRRCATRYTDDSPIPNRLLISETGVSVSAYNRVTSRSCSSLSTGFRKFVALSEARVAKPAERGS